MNAQLPSDQHPTALTGPPDPISEPGTSAAIESGSSKPFPLQPMGPAHAHNGEVASAVGSVPAQTFANLGHLLFKDNPARSERTQNVISILRAIGPTPAEFVPLQWAISLSDPRGRLL
jgi:hypothetical protein